jgi:Spy/CpxP family protein refolding chaperone
MMARVIFLLCFLCAFGAGIFAGVLWERRAKPPPDGWLSDLNLSAEQREKIGAIWTDPLRATNRQARREKREAAQKERDDALRALVIGEQKQRYEDILGAYQKRLEEIAQEARKANDEAYQRTKLLLTESQRALYDEVRRKREEAHGRGRIDASKKQPGEYPSDKGASPSAVEQKKEARTER